MNAYAEMKKRHQEEVNALPMYWAFSDEQFNQQLKELGLTRNDTGKLCKTFGGGFCLASDAQMIADTLRGHRREMEEAREADLTRADHRAKAVRRDSARIPERMMTWYLHLN